ncbi:MAG: hypothetical protein ACKOEI_12495, partial [Chthoniobacterales bacterium]
VLSAPVMCLLSIIGVWIAAFPEGRSRWWYASLVASLSLMGTLMANDAGTVDAAAQTTMVLLVLVGQILGGAAGIPLGLSIFWSTRRKLLLRIFAGLLAAGVVLVIVGVYAFASKLTA